MGEFQLDNPGKMYVKLSHEHRSEIERELLLGTMH